MADIAAAMRRNWPLLCILVFFIPVCAHGIRLGYASHGDSRLIFENSVPAILHGRYVPSRSYGNPLYEAFAAIVFLLGGLTAANFCSAAFALAGLILFAVLLNKIGAEGWRAFWPLAGFALNPLFLINATSPIEWSLALLLFLCTLYFADRWLKDRAPPSLAGYSIALAAMVLTRPDFGAVAASVVVAVLWELRLERKSSTQFIAATAAAGLATIAVFLVINGGPSFFLRAKEMAGSATLARRAIVSALGTINLFGIVGIAVIAWIFAGLLRGILRDAGRDASFFEKLFVVALPLGLLRYWALSTKLEYLLPLVPIVLLGIARRPERLPLLALVAASLMLNSLFTISLFERKPESDDLHVALRLNESALLQDWDERRAIQISLSPAFENRITATIFGRDASPDLHLHLKDFNPGFTNPKGDAVIPRSVLYKFDNPRLPDPSVSSRSYRRIYVCDAPFPIDDRGWRTLQSPPDYSPLQDDAAPIPCTVYRPSGS